MKIMFLSRELRRKTEILIRITFFVNQKKFFCLCERIVFKTFAIKYLRSASLVAVEIGYPSAKRHLVSRSDGSFPDNFHFISDNDFGHHAETVEVNLCLQNTNSLK